MEKRKSEEINKPKKTCRKVLKELFPIIYITFLFPVLLEIWKEIYNNKKPMPFSTPIQSFPLLTFIWLGTCFGIYVLVRGLGGLGGKVNQKSMAQHKTDLFFLIFFSITLGKYCILLF